MTELEKEAVREKACRYAAACYESRRAKILSAARDRHARYEFPWPVGILSLTDKIGSDMTSWAVKLSCLGKPSGSSTIRLAQQKFNTSSF